eukprot:Awhi_evm1s9240
MSDQVQAGSIVEEMKAYPQESHEYPSSHPTVKDNPLEAKSIKELKSLISDNNLSFPEGAVEKEDLIQVLIDNNITAA